MHPCFYVTLIVGVAMFVLEVEKRRPEGSWSGKAHECEMHSTWFFSYISNQCCMCCTQHWGMQNDKNWFWTVSTLGGCGGLQRTDFEQFLIWDSMVVGVVVWWSWKNWFWTVSTLGRYDALERTDFEQFLLWEGVVVFKDLILNSFYFGTV